MTNIEKVKRILDAGHWVKVTYEGGTTFTITSYINNSFSYINENEVNHCIFSIMDVQFQDCTIEVIQRIPTPYVAGDKVIVLSNPTNNSSMSAMVGKVCEIRKSELYRYAVWYELEYSTFLFPAHCLAPAFDEPKEEPTLSVKEVTVMIDGKEYTAVMK